MPWRLMVKNLGAHRLRTSLTLGSLVVAIFLLCFLRTILVGLEAGVAASASNRLVVQSAVSLFVDLPQAYHGKLEGVEGVEEVCKLQWFGGIYQDPSNFFAQFGVDADRLLTAYPEITLLEGSREAFEADRTGCLIGEKLAERYGWGIGDRVPLIGTIFPRTDGRSWEFTVQGIYASRSANVDESTMWFHYAYLDESLDAGAATGPRGVGVFVLRLDRGAEPVGVAERVEAMFRNGPQAVQATTEAEFQRQFVTMLGSVPTFISSIGGGVLFAILLAVLNAMLMASRERTRDLGILKALGFTDAVAFGLLLGESLVLCLLGGLLGVGLAYATQPAMASFLSTILPNYAITPGTAALGLGVALGVGLVAGLIPGVQASRLDVVEALRAEV